MRSGHFRPFSGAHGRLRSQKHRWTCLETAEKEREGERKRERERERERGSE